MMQESLINNPLLAGIAITLIHFLWQGLLVALVLKLLLSLISYQKSQTRYALASTAMLTNLILPLITFFIVYDNSYRQAASFVQTLPLLERGFYLEQIQANAWYIEWLEYLPAISIFWLSVVTLLSVKLLVELYNVNKLPVQGTLPADSALNIRFQGLSHKIGLTKKVTLLLSSKTNVPMAIGWLKPVVLIPFSMVSGLTPQQLDMLLLHELAHIRRHDYLINFLQTLVETLLFFHPTVRWVSKQMRNEREYCSDDIAVQHGSSAIAYAHTLADTASLCQKHRQHAIPSMAMAASGGDLKQRVVRLLDNQAHCSQTTDSGRWLASFTILLAIIFGFSKYSLTLPVIDLQSGSISLSRSPIELNKNPMAYSPLIIDSLSASSSLANQLIALNDTKNKTNKGPAATKVTDKKNDLMSNNQQEKFATAVLTTPNSMQTRQNAKSEHIDELPIVVNSPEKQGREQVQNNLIAEATLTDRQVSISGVNKSISDLAFERTDSKNTATTLANPYAGQVASLLDIPKTVNPQFDVQHQSKLTVLDSAKTPENTYRRIDNRINNKFNDANASDFTIDHKILPTNSLAKLITSMEPRYPSSAKRKGIELEVMVEFTIDKSGFVRDIQFESKSKVNYFRNAIRNAMDKWRFLPAEENGTAVESKMSKIFSFSLLK